MAFFMNNRHTGENRDRRGFTLAELLIVVAIIAVLTAIAIPIFAKELERSRDMTTVANLRTAYAEAVNAYISHNGATQPVYEYGYTFIPEGPYTSRPQVIIHSVRFAGTQPGLDYGEEYPFPFITDWVYTSTGKLNTAPRGYYSVTFEYDENFQMDGLYEDAPGGYEVLNDNPLTIRYPNPMWVLIDVDDPIQNDW